MWCAAADAVRAYTPIGFQAGEREVLSSFSERLLFAKEARCFAWMFSQANLASSVLINR